MDFHSPHLNIKIPAHFPPLPTRLQLCPGATNNLALFSTFDSRKKKKRKKIGKLWQISRKHFSILPSALLDNLVAQGVAWEPAPSAFCAVGSVNILCFHTTRNQSINITSFQLIWPGCERIFCYVYGYLTMRPGMSPIRWEMGESITPHTLPG